MLDTDGRINMVRESLVEKKLNEGWVIKGADQQPNAETESPSEPKQPFWEPRNRKAFLVVLYHASMRADGIRVQEIADALGYTPVGARNFLNEMAEHDWLSKEQDPNNKRACVYFAKATPLDWDDEEVEVAIASFKTTGPFNKNGSLVNPAKAKRSNFGNLAKAESENKKVLSQFVSAYKAFREYLRGYDGPITGELIGITNEIDEFLTMRIESVRYGCPYCGNETLETVGLTLRCTTCGQGVMGGSFEENLRKLRALADLEGRQRIPRGVETPHHNEGEIEMIEFECPYCKGSDIDFGTVSLDWLSNDEVTAWDECVCNDCKKKFEIRTEFHATKYQYYDETGMEPLGGEWKL